MRRSAVGVRELRQRASELLRRVEGGETIRITVHGRFVAILSPAAVAEDPLAKLRAAGETVFGGKRLDDVGEPLEIGRKNPATRVLRKLRARER
jgi:prevent-host-death family protein